MKKTMAIISDVGSSGGTLATKHNIRRNLEEYLLGTGIMVEFRWLYSSSDNIPIGNVIVCILVGNRLGISELAKDTFEEVRNKIDDVYTFANGIQHSPYFSYSFIAEWAKNNYNPNHTESYSVF